MNRNALVRAVLIAILVLLVPSSAAAAAPPAARGWLPPLPVPLSVVRPFDPPDSPYGAGHRGVDVAAAAGSPVRAPGAGVVRFAGRLVDRGVVSVDSGGLRFTYEPVHPLVRVGQQVAAGSVLGLLEPGHPGCSTCLHWGVRSGREYLDPLRPVRIAIRLLPLDGQPVAAEPERPTRLPRDGPPPVVLPATAGLALAALALRRG